MNNVYTNRMLCLKLFCLAVWTCAQTAHGWTVITFDDPDLWTAGSGALSSYQDDHLYAESGWVFSGGPALRQTTSQAGGGAGAQGVYAWRLRDEAGTVWRAEWNGEASLASVRFDVRSWNDEDSFVWVVRTYLGGVGQAAGEWLIDRERLGAGVEWHTMEIAVDGVTGADGLLIEFERLSGERLLVDNFAFVAVPEAAHLALLFGSCVLLISIVRRRKR